MLGRNEITKWLVNINFTEIAFEQRAEGGRSRCIGIWGKSVPSRWNSLWKDSEARVCLSCVSKIKNARVPEAELEWRDVMRSEVSKCWIL